MFGLSGRYRQAIALVFFFSCSLVSLELRRVCILSMYLV